MQKRLDFPLFLFVVVISILFTITMESSISVYLTDTYNQNYFIYQALLYALAGFIVVKNRRQIRTDRFMIIIWTFSLLCFFASLLHIQSFSIRSFIALFFNTCIIPFALLCGLWLGGKLNSVKDRDIYLIILQIPALYAMSLLRAYNAASGYWFDADAAFCIIVFLPFVFFFKRSWLSVIFAFIYIIFALTSGKRSIILFVTFCLVIYIVYLFFYVRKGKHNNLFNRLLVIALFTVGAYYVLSNENSGLLHAIDRTESLGGMTDDNGRINIYGRLTAAIEESDGFSILFGHGHMAVKNDIGMGAHNDLLEIAYDYGMIAASLYFIILLRYIIMVFKLVRKKDYQVAMTVGISISSILILGLLNCIVVSTILLFSMYFALGCGLEIRNKSINQI